MQILQNGDVDEIIFSVGELICPVDPTVPVFR